ncbi:hypothetical protein HZH68_001395 [Vespula germanica]|uniref:Uncharacterized protein n=1 Tax=Vespula germanica TaxID=30212 RepID=A0A834U6X1_VESGE|nr:hypothetical protein HZH68_001395 [Vespula germanica]
MAGWLLHKSMRASSNDKSKFHGEKQSRRRDEARHPFSAHRESLDRTVSSFMDGRLYVPTGTRTREVSRKNGQVAEDLTNGSRAVSSLRRTKLTNIVHYQRWRCSKSVPSLRELLEKGTINSLTWAIMTEYLDPHFIRALCRDPERRNLQDLQIIYYGLLGLEALRPCRDSILRGLCKIVRYERHNANHVLYYADNQYCNSIHALSGLTEVKLPVCESERKEGFVTTYCICIISAPVNWQPAGTYCSQVLCLSMDPCTCPAPADEVYVSRIRLKPVVPAKAIEVHSVGSLEGTISSKALIFEFQSVYHEAASSW